MAALLPVLVVLGAWAGARLSPAAAQLDPTVALAERYVRQQSHPLQYAAMTPEELALQRASENPKDIIAAAAQVRHRFDLAFLLFGGWVGLVIGVKFLLLSWPSTRTEYEPDRGACVACARCFAVCPHERARLRSLIPKPEAVTP